MRCRSRRWIELEASPVAKQRAARRVYDSTWYDGRAHAVAVDKRVTSLGNAAIGKRRGHHTCAARETLCGRLPSNEVP